MRFVKMKELNLGPFKSLNFNLNINFKLEINFPVNVIVNYVFIINNERIRE